MGPGSVSPIYEAACSHQQELGPSGWAGVPRCPHQPTLSGNLIGSGPRPLMRFSLQQNWPCHAKWAP